VTIRPEAFLNPVHTVAALAWLIMSVATPHATNGQTEGAGQQAPIRIGVTGESNLRSNFIESLKDAAKDNRLPIEIVPRSDPGLTYTVIIAQETTIASAAAAVIALDKNGDVAASVVRSGRMSGRGALNACAKELVKKLLVLAR
jgi:hypothetical protein